MRKGIFTVRIVRPAQALEIFLYEHVKKGLSVYHYIILQSDFLPTAPFQCQTFREHDEYLIIRELRRKLVDTVRYRDRVFKTLICPYPEPDLLTDHSGGFEALDLALQKTEPYRIPFYPQFHTTRSGPQ